MTDLKIKAQHQERFFFLLFLIYIHYKVFVLQ